ncbi:bifunctional DNA-formamidopyrimidine glycosylase/DNA-(apurinic or apyrimidinic site) lyase [Nesterenkonia flava]|uniref:Formamidopyrimidine-DNA glycosylase n=1 Tax=Nesterenkonia flava TaxID=469799 RepID=A0ABU1FRQ1_9MICC|nr:bifunctional DNA-formamidopyrimidine glycosylase/DNA-(apurinic or apyrimidinic site) lyase [Nesterenkonia flava]MDR5711340.1 bifunctional DNA-formamidopyrimidine glycosylase/DNA-(apurinic or apyrimidinic site) lyase [Nesterenkonia flava]
MPELPEVEVVRRGVQTWAAGRTVETVTVHDSRSLRRHIPADPTRTPVEDFTGQLTGATLGTPARRGKYLWIPFVPACSGGTPPALLIHLGMSGQVLMEEQRAPAEKHLKVTFDLGPLYKDAGAPGQMRFVDQRIFGHLLISPLVDADHASGSVPAVAVHIAQDPLESGYEAETLFRRLRSRRSGLKRALLDQTVISGIGNIYADEALWLAKLHYARRTETITRAEAMRLLSAVQQVMRAALEAGGTSFDSLYVNVNGASGYFARSLECYGRAGQPCRRCAAAGLTTAVRREAFANRSSYWCPRCQPRPRNGRW